MRQISSILVVLLFTFLASCVDSCVPRPPRWEIAIPTLPQRPSPKPANSTDHLVVYLDTSASMAGYISPNGKANFAASPDGTVFSRTLVGLRDVVTTISPEPAPVIRRVDTAISAPSFGDIGLSQAAANRALYVGRETNLAGAIKSFSDSFNKQSDDPVPARFHILVTDGVQSSNQDDSENSCFQGSDAHCVKKRLKELMDSGWGGTVFGLRSEFQGTVYSELDHGKAVPYSSKKDQSTYRPFFMYVFSPDPTSLDKLVGVLKQKLTTLVGPGNFHEYALTSDYSAGVSSIEVQLAQDKQTRDLIEVRQERVKEGETPRLTVRSKSGLSVADKGAQQFVVNVTPAWTDHAISAGSKDELGNMIKWELRPVVLEKEDPNRRYPSFSRVDKSEMHDGNIGLTFETGWIKGAGGADWRMYQLIGWLDVERTAPPWVASWSTDNDRTAETANRTLNLESSLANLWNNVWLQKYPVAEVFIRVGPK
jgi:hypothetical protein